MKTKYSGLTLVLSLLAVQACGDSTGPAKPSRVVVSPPSTTMASLGESVQYTARLEDKNGKEIPDVAVTWSVTDAQVANISGTGLLTGIKAGAASVRATAEGITGSASLIIDPVPSQVEKVAGDLQAGALRQVLPGLPTVEVKDANGFPVPGKFVFFSVAAGGGMAVPSQAQTGSDGRASTVWQLGCSNENPQRLDATVGGITVSFSAEADLDALAICQDSVPEGRETQPYATTLEAAGGDQGTVTWSLMEGSLPPGILLQSSGVLSGVPTQAGSYDFQARAQDGLGAFASASFTLRICDAPLSLAPGDRVFLPAMGETGCGLFLPSGSDGDRYRVGVLYSRTNEDDPSDVATVTVTMKREIGGLPASENLLSSAISGGSIQGTGPRIAAQVPPGMLESLEVSRATEALHNRIRLAERELIRSLGPDARPLPDRRSDLLARSSGPVLASPEKMSFTNADGFTSCTVSETRRAIKVKENDIMVIYQDSIQRDSDPLPDSNAQSILDFYASYGPQVIAEYFGGISDINGDGKVVVFVTPVVESGTAAFVWSGDFFPKTNQPGWVGCAASNQMELIRFSLSVIKGLSQGNYQALGTAVHEVKHISSLYKSLMRSSYFPDYYQPLWVEEGTAEIAKEMASRIAWASKGGPAVGAMARGSDVNAFTPENYGIILVHANTTGYLSSQPNGIVVTPTGASSDHSVYGSGWHFHRWLGDAYGNAATPLGDTALFRTLNDSLTATGVEGVLHATGAASWTGLLEEYLAAVMLNGTGAPQGPKAFTSYNFITMNRTFTYDGKPTGDYPWPVNLSGSNTTAPFATATLTGSIGPSGIRIYDLTSNGTGLGLEVKVTPSSGILDPFRIVVVRIE